MSNMRSLQYSIYKGMGGKFAAVQLSFQAPHYYKGRDKDFTGDTALDSTGKLKRTEGWEQREGAVFLEIAPTVDKNKYDWEKKITVALSVTDMGKFIVSLATGSEMNLTHDPGAKTETQGAIKKYVKFESKEGILEKGGMLTVTQMGGPERMSYMVPLSTDECFVLRQLLTSAVSKALNWA